MKHVRIHRLHFADIVPYSLMPVRVPYSFCSVSISKQCPYSVEERPKRHCCIPYSLSYRLSVDVDLLRHMKTRNLLPKLWCSGLPSFSVHEHIQVVRCRFFYCTWSPTGAPCSQCHHIERLGGCRICSFFQLFSWPHRGYRSHSDKAEIQVTNMAAWKGDQWAEEKRLFEKLLNSRTSKIALRNSYIVKRTYMNHFFRQLPPSNSSTV